MRENGQSLTCTVFTQVEDFFWLLSRRRVRLQTTRSLLRLAQHTTFPPSHPKPAFRGESFSLFCFFPLYCCVAHCLYSRRPTHTPLSVFFLPCLYSHCLFLHVQAARVTCMRLDTFLFKQSGCSGRSIFRRGETLIKTRKRKPVCTSQQRGKDGMMTYRTCFHLDV